MVSVQHYLMIDLQGLPRMILLLDSSSLLILYTESFGLGTTKMIPTNIRIMLKEKGI